MAGLLAWAADVVAGNGNSSPPQQQQQIPSFRFTPEQQEHVRRLDARAAALQQGLQQLRQRIPPPHLAHSLPHLHADSVASHSALTMERDAHQATLKQAQAREASLQAENAAYAKAIAAGKQQAREKAQEAKLLEARLQELEVAEQNLKAEVDRLEGLLTEKEQLGHGTQQQLEGIEKENAPVMSSGDKAFVEAEELQRTRAELKLWEDKVAKLEKEWLILQQNIARWPSPAQREKELERMLRSLTEQLVAKQAQAESLASERNALELRLEQASEARRQLVLGNVDVNFKRNKIGRFAVSTASTSASCDESKIHSQPGIGTMRQRGSRGSSDNLGRVGGMDIWNWQIFSQLRSMMLVRALTVVYILGLHVIVFFIISFSS